MFGLMAPPRAASPPAPPPAQAVVSPARPSPPVLPLAMMPNDLGTPGATSIDNSSDSDNQDTARVLEDKIKQYTRQIPTPPPQPMAPTTLPSDDKLLALMSPDNFRLTPYQPAPDPALSRTSVGNADIGLGGAEVRELQSGGSSDAWEQRIVQRVHDYPDDLEAQLNYELLEYLQERQVPDMATMASLAPEDHEVLSALMDGLSNFRNGIRADSNMLLSEKIAPLVEMSDRLKEQAELTLPTVALCTSVSSFGSFTPVADAKFQAGRENEVIVYCEVQNFASRLNTQGLWETKLTMETVLYTEDGEPVWPDNPQAEPVDDVCRERRHDFFIRRKITLPANLSIQRYLLKISVTDEEVNRIAEATTPVNMVADVGGGN